MATPPEAVERRGVTGPQFALVIGGLIAILGVVWFFFLRGGAEEPVVTAPVPTPTVDASPSPTPTDEPPRGRRGRVETFELFAAQDPFEPLVVPGAVGGATTATGTNGQEPGTEQPGEQPGDGGNGDVGPGPGPGGGGERIGGRRVRVVDVFTEGGTRRAQIQVDGTVYTVDEGETFAENFRLLSTSGECATLLFGDDQFTLCEGEEILK